MIFFRKLVLCYFSISLCLYGCSGNTSNELIIPLPGKLNGEFLVLAETSANSISINQDVVPSKIEYIWWDLDYVVTKIHPMRPRKKFSGDSYKYPDKNIWEWYIIDLKNQEIFHCPLEKDYQNQLKKLSLSPEDVKFMSLLKAKRLREKQLGFSFTSLSVRDYLQKQNLGKTEKE